VMQCALALSRRVSARAPAWNPLRHIPRLPGRLGSLVRKDARELLSFLDPYVAMALSAGGALYRFFGAHPDPAAFPILSLLLALALSTSAQSLFALDGDPGMTRYRLLPLHGWQILLAKDIAFLAILFVLLLPLDPGPGMTFGLAALAIGHHPSVLETLPQQRWRFTGGRVFVCALQSVGGTALGFASIDHGALLLVAVAVWCVSVWYYGRRLDHQTWRTL
jgi:hypothetical protein